MENVLLKNPAVKGIQTSKLEMIWIPDVKRTMRRKMSFPHHPQPQRKEIDINVSSFFLPSLFLIIIITFISTSTQSKEADTATIIYLVGTQLVYFSE